MNIACCQEIRRKVEGSKYIEEKLERYKAFWTSADDRDFGGVAILMEKQREQYVFSMRWISQRIIALRMRQDDCIVIFFSAYASQRGLDNERKDTFYDDLYQLMNTINNNEMIYIGRDFNENFGTTASWHSNTHRGHGYGVPNNEAIRLLNFCECYGLVIRITWFTKRSKNLIIFLSGRNNSQVDFIITRRSQLKMVTNTKLIRKESFTQNRLLVSDFKTSQHN